MNMVAIGTLGFFFASKAADRPARIPVKAPGDRRSGLELDRFLRFGMVGDCRPVLL